MLRFFKKLSLNRPAWLLLFLSGFALEGCALYFQHIMGLAPCVMCIYERLALLAIMAAGLLGFIAPKVWVIRWLALILGIFGAVKGLLLAIKHTDYQLHPAPWNQCTFFVDFPPTLPLNKWFPNLFEATGSCNDITWQFLNLTMPQWLIGIFAIYLSLLIVVTLSQFKRVNHANNRSLFH